MSLWDRADEWLRARFKQPEVIADAIAGAVALIVCGAVFGFASVLGIL